MKTFLAWTQSHCGTSTAVDLSLGTLKRISCVAHRICCFSYTLSIKNGLTDQWWLNTAYVSSDALMQSMWICYAISALRGSFTKISKPTRPADCDRQEGIEEGALRLRGGFGTPCDPVHSGFVEVLHLGEWGSICSSLSGGSRSRHVADVVCRQLGFPHGTRVDPFNPLPPPGEQALSPDGSYYDTDSDEDRSDIEEAEEPCERFWLEELGLTCTGPEARLIDCDLGEGFRRNSADCRLRAPRFHVACRQFPVAAFEAITTPDAGTATLQPNALCAAGSCFA